MNIAFAIQLLILWSSIAGCTIIASSLYGSALTLLCADYFVENFRIIHWFLDKLSNGDDWYGLLVGTQRNVSLCYGSQIIFALWPVLTLFGIIIQNCCTAKGVRYRDGYGIVATASSSIMHHKSIGLNGSLSSSSRSTLASLNRHRTCDNSEESQLEQKHRKYRYLYQVRTAHGDVISQVSLTMTVVVTMFANSFLRRIISRA